MGRQTVPSTNQTQKKSGPRLLIVDDRTLLVDGLSRVLQSTPYIVSTNPARDAESVIAQAWKVSPETILIGSQLADLAADAPITTTLSELGARIVVLTYGKDQLTRAGLLEQGANGFVDILDPYAKLEEALRCLSRGTSAIDPVTMQKLARIWREHRATEAARLAPFHSLSKREAAILLDIYNGLGAAQIAEESFVSINTVRSQIRSILEKLHVGSQVGAVALARKNGWFESQAS